MVHQVNLLCLGTLLLTYAVFSYSHGSYDLYALKQECSPWNSCWHMRPEYARDFTQRNCECDFLCTAFNDCCYDAPARLKYPYDFKNRLDTCMPYGEYDDGIFVVGRCPRNYSASMFIKRFCEGKDDFRDPMMSTPASRLSSATTYRNRYCTMCHGVPESELMPWKAYIRFDDSYPRLTDAVFVNKRDFIFSHDFKKWGVYNGDTFRPFELIFKKPDCVTDVRHCRDNLISFCPKSWKYDHIARDCRSYLGVVHHKHRSYRNVDCAICNGVDVGELTCDDSNYAYVRKRRFVQPDPFVVLLNQGEFSSRQPKCRYGLTYDRFRKMCRDLSSIN